MGILTPHMQAVVREQKLGFVATVCPDGTPNLSPKGTTTVLDDDHLVFADIWSPGTVDNLRSNPWVEINVVDPVIRKGYRFKGWATLVGPGPAFERLLRVFGDERAADLAGRVKTIVVVRVERALPLISPVYDSGATEAEVRARWERYWDARRSMSTSPENASL
jgi:predicted pyridoxine 5'-phosphate oxidase superfamily flavin-nucleotide-binding protein